MAELIVEKAGLIGIDRAQRQNRLREDRVPMDRRHAAGLKGGFESVNILRAKISRLRGMRMGSQVCEKLTICRNVLHDGAARSQRPAEFSLSANSTGKGYRKCSRAQAGEIDLDRVKQKEQEARDKMAGLDKLSEEFLKAEASLRKALARERLARKRSGSGSL